MFSCLYRCDALAPFNPIILAGLPSYIVVTVNNKTGAPLILHAAPGVPSPDGSAPIFGDGKMPWTWGGFASAQPTLALLCHPHEWAGEDTASDVVGINDPRFYPNPQPVL